MSTWKGKKGSSFVPLLLSHGFYCLLLFFGVLIWASFDPLGPCNLAVPLGVRHNKTKLQHIQGLFWFFLEGSFNGIQEKSLPSSSTIKLSSYSSSMGSSSLSSSSSKAMPPCRAFKRSSAERLRDILGFYLGFLKGRQGLLSCEV